MTDRYRNFCFTINNYDEKTEEDVLLKLPYKYLIYGFEVGDSGTPHIQGYCVLNDKVRFRTLKQWMPTAHIEKRKGTHDEAADYCKKDGNFKEHGHFRPGERTDLDEVREMCTDPLPMTEITAICNYQQIRTAEKFLNYNEPGRNEPPNVTWLYGASGSGKSRKARELADELKRGPYYTKNEDSKWWNGYDAHDIVIIDDYRSSWWSATYLLALLDRYQFQVECKGGLRQFRARHIFITTINSPESEWARNYSNEDVRQLLRRITKTIHCVSI